jgi:hypothetical protein
MIRHPVPGNILAFFHYLVGLERLGHQVFYIEESGWPNSCYNPESLSYSDDCTFGLALVRRLLTQHGLRTSLAFVNRDSGETFGDTWRNVTDALKSADLLLNVGGVCWLPEFKFGRCRVLIDMDPMFTQVGRFASEGLREYHFYYSYGTNIGNPNCSIPDCGIAWRPTVPPVVPDLWRQSDSGKLSNCLTTIANWSAYGTVTYQGKVYGQKDLEFERFIEVPLRTMQCVELALSGGGQPITEKFTTYGWKVRAAAELNRSFAAYRDYICNSRGEFSVAKHGYVESRSGWISDRSVCYLAAGRPIQDSVSGSVWALAFFCFRTWMRPSPLSKR